MKKRKGFKGLIALFVVLIGVVGLVFGLKVLAEDEAGKITASKTAVATADNRGAEVTLEINTTELEAPTVDVVLIMDRSGSMKECVDPNGATNWYDGSCYYESQNRMETAIKAAKSMVDALLGGANKENVRIAYVTFSTGVEANNKFYKDTEISSLKNAINGTDAEGGTNLQSALVKANDLLEDSTASYKMVVVVTDGEPSFFTINGVTHGIGNKDEHETCDNAKESGAKYTDYSYTNNKKTRTRSCKEKDGTVLYVETSNKTCGWGGNDWCAATVEYPNGEPMKPSEAAKVAADTLKENGANIYAIGFGTDAEHLGNFLTNDIASGSGFVYTATDTDNLNDAMGRIASEINNLLAINAEVVDVVPKEFELPTDTFAMVAIDKEGKETTISNDKVNFITCSSEELEKEGTKCTEVGQTIIDVDMGNIVSTVKTYRITYNVAAKPEYSGAIYTNKEATLTATATEANGYYEDKNINIPFDKPVVAVGAITNDDDYTETPLLDGATGVYDVIANDSKILSDASIHYINNAGVFTPKEGKSEVVATVVVDSTSCGTATVVDNKISYNSAGCSKDNGNVEVKYHVNLKVTIDGVETVIDSKDALGGASSTVSIKVNKVPTTYTVKYLDEDGNNVAEEKTVDNVYVGDSVIENAVEDEKYTVDQATKELVLVAEGNEIVFNYSLKEVSYVVIGIDRISKETLYNNTNKGKVTKAVTVEAKDVEKYDLDDLSEKSITLSLNVEDNVITFYYLPRKTITTTIRVEGQKDQSSPEEYRYNEQYSTSGLTEDEIPEGYELKEVIGQPTGNATEDKEVIYVYGLKEFTVTTVYEYEVKEPTRGANYTSVSNPVTKKYGETYQTHGDSELAPEYELASITGEESGTVTGDVTVTYRYNLKRVTITTVCKYEDGETVTTPVTYIYGETYETSCESDGTYDVELPEDPTGTATEDKEVVYEHTKKRANLVVRYLEQGSDAVVKAGKNEQVKWGEEYNESAPVIENYTLVSEKDNYTGTIIGDVTITFYYALSDASLTVKHVLAGTETTIVDTVVTLKKYTDSYETAAIDDYRYTYVGLAKDSDPASGTIDKESVVVTYEYTQNTGTVLVKHLEQGTDNELKIVPEVTKNYGDTYETTDALASLTNYDLVDLAEGSDPANGTVNKPSTVVTYYYKLKTATYVVKYLENETNNVLATEINTTMNYGEEYKATDSVEIPANYQRTDTDGDKLEGVISKPSYEIIFYYEKKNSQLETEVHKDTSVEKITEVDQVVPYSITYSAKITDYIGKATVTIVDELSYAIDEEKSSLANGVYDSEALTITWVEEYDVNSYEDGVNYTTLNIVKEIELVYANLDATERTVSNSVTANITLDNGTSNNGDEVVIDSEIEGIINVHYVDVETGEVLGKVETNTGLVGSVLEIDVPEFEDYTLTEVPDEEEYVYTVGEHDITYYFVKNQVAGVVEEDDGEVLGVTDTNNPNTGDIVVMFFGLLALSVAGIAITTKKIVNR